MLLIGIVFGAFIIGVIIAGLPSALFQFILTVLICLIIFGFPAMKLGLKIREVIDNVIANFRR